MNRKAILLACWRSLNNRAMLYYIAEERAENSAKLASQT
jgi:hypothetical protein